VLKASKYVGYIPVSNDVAILVQPKAPIGNLFWMAWKAALPPKRLEGFLRGYQLLRWDVESPESLYVDTFLAAMEAGRRKGILKKYRLRESSHEWRGRLLLSPTVNRFRSKGVGHRAAFQVVDFTADVLENRILKHTARRLLRHLESHPNAESAQVARTARRLLGLFATVDDSQVIPEVIARTGLRLIRELPGAYSEYEPALWLAYLIATKSGVVMEEVGGARFESVLIDVPLVFESYVRTIVVEAQESGTHFRGHVVLDGNKVPLPLFVRGKKSEVEPDLYVTLNNKPVAVADAKYKAEPSRADRYETLAHCDAAKVKVAVFICPLVAGTEAYAHLGTTQSGITMHVVRIDLASTDLSLEQTRFLDQLSRILLGEDDTTREETVA